MAEEVPVPEAITYAPVNPPAEPITWGGDLGEARHELHVRT